MSNPYMNKNTDLSHVPDSAFLSAELKLRIKEYEGGFSPAHRLSKVWSMIENLDVLPQHGVLVPPTYVVSGDMKSAQKVAEREAIKNGVEYDPLNRAMWPILSTAVKNIEFRRRTATAYRFRLLLERCIAEYDPRLEAPIRASVMNVVMTRASPRHCLGRLIASYPKKTDVLGVGGAITREEALQGLRDVGFDLTYLCYLKMEGLLPEAYGYNGNADEKQQIKVNLKASAGAPIGGLVGEPAVMTAVIKMADMVYEQVESYIASCTLEKVVTHGQLLPRSIKVKGFEVVSAQMRVLSQKFPELYTIIWKAKADVCKMEKVMDKNRVINNIPAPVRFIIASAAQALADVLPSAQDELRSGYDNAPGPHSKANNKYAHVLGRRVFYATTPLRAGKTRYYYDTSKTYKGCTMSGPAFQADMEALCKCRENILLEHFEGDPRFKFDFRVNGDDSKVSYVFGNVVGEASFDVTNMDQCQHRDMNREVHKGIYEGLSLVDPVPAALWLLTMRENHVVIEGKHTVKMLHGATSGISMIDVNNGAIMAVFIRRVMNEVAKTLDEFDNDPFSSPAGHSPEDVMMIMETCTAAVAQSMLMPVRLECNFATDFRDSPYDDSRRGTLTSTALRHFYNVGQLTPRVLSNPSAPAWKKYFLRLYQLRRDLTGEAPIFLGFEIGPSERPGDNNDPYFSVNHDLGRMVAGISYPNKFHYKPEELEAKEAARLASTFLALGRGNERFYRKVVVPVKSAVIAMLENHAESSPNVSESNGRFMVFVGEDMDNSIIGLLNFLKGGGFERLWSNAGASLFPSAEEEETPLLAPAPNTLQELALNALIRANIDDGRNLVRHLGPTNPGAKPNPSNFGRRPPTREEIWVEKMRGSLRHMDNADVVGMPKGGRKMTVGQWKKMLQTMDDDGYDEGALLDDEQDVEDRPNRSWADYDSDDSAEERYREGLKQEDEMYRRDAEDQEEEQGQDNMARHRAGF